MNMRSIITPVADAALVERPSLARRTLAWLKARRFFLMIVVAPTLLLAAYYYLVAADQYQSEAHFMVKSAESQPTMPTGFGQILGLTGASSPGESQAMSVSDYLMSHDAVNELRRRVGLVGRFQRPEADFFSRLHGDDPTPEKLLRYYKGKVDVHFDHDTGITTLEVRAFRPDDAYAIIQQLLSLGEARINALNERSFNDAVSNARRQLTKAEADVSAIQTRITDFRQSRGDIDPQGSGAAQIKLVSEVNGNLAAARVQLSTMGGLISHTSPQYIALERQVRSLEAQAAAQSNIAAGGSSTIATDLGGYEDLRLQQEFAAKRYEAAAADLEKAREQAQRQQLYLVRVVEPNLPVKSLYPERGRILLTVFLGLVLVYSIGWLIAAGVREHAA